MFSDEGNLKVITDRYVNVIKKIFQILQVVLDDSDVAFNRWEMFKTAVLLVPPSNRPSYLVSWAAILQLETVRGFDEREDQVQL